MNALILTAKDAEALDALNATGNPRLQIRARPLTAGGFALNADLLDDCGAGGTWFHYRGLLQSLDVADVDESDFVQPKNSPSE